MSFQFPKPVLDESTNNPDFEFISDAFNRKLFNNPEPDYDELVIRLSFFAFSRLSPSDQREQVEYVRCIVKSEEEEEQRPVESDEAFRLRSFSQLFKKLNFSDQLKLLDRFFQKLKRARQLGELISSFKQLDAEHQQQLIENCVVEVPPENLRNPGEPDDDFRLRRYTELSTYYTAHVYKRFVAWKNAKKCADEQEETSDDENNSDWKSSFFEFFLGFSIYWFQGQSSSGQDMLIEQLLRGVGGGVVIQNRLQDENEEDFKLRRFTELCKKVVDFRVQEKFLDNARSRLKYWGTVHFSSRLILEPQEYDSAAELLSSLSSFGFSLISAEYQQLIIDEMSNQFEGGVIIERRPAAEEESTEDEEEEESTEDEEDFRMRRFTELFNQLPVDARIEMSNQVEGGVIIERRPAAEEESTEDEEDFTMRRFTELFNQLPVDARIDLFKVFRKIFSTGKCYFESIRFFKRLGSKDQAEMIDKLFYKITEYRSSSDSAKLIMEKLSEESDDEGDFRLRRFEKMCFEELSTCKDFIKYEAEKRVREGTLQLHTTSGNEQSFCYSEFLFGLSLIWFKARCANYRRNPVQLVLFGYEVEFGDIVEKLPEESEEDFRLRRFTESFKRLEVTSQDVVVDYIQHTLFSDLGCPRRNRIYSEVEVSFRPQFIKMKIPNLKDEAAASQGAGTGGHGASQP